LLETRNKAYTTTLYASRKTSISNKQKVKD
jgi:hypothetical protein